MTMVLNLPMICLGRFICGITSGHANIIMSKSIDETVPSEVSGPFGVLLNLYTCIGIMLSFFLGGILPTQEDLLADDEMWRVIYGMPAVFAIV